MHSLPLLVIDSTQRVCYLILHRRMHLCSTSKRGAKILVSERAIAAANVPDLKSVNYRSIDASLLPVRLKCQHNLFRSFFSSAFFRKQRSSWLSKPKPKTSKDGAVLAAVTTVPFQLDGFHYTLLAALALFCFFDVFWFVRALDPILRAYARETFRFRTLSSRTQKNLPLKDVLQKTTYRSWCTTQDLDMLFHMNNVRYLREMDFARFQHFTVTGVGHFLVEFKARTVVAASTIRYRKSVALLEKYFIETQILCWDSTALYMEQRFVAPNGMAKAVAYYKMHVSVPDMNVNELMRRVCNCGSPAPPDYIKSWMTFNTQSSDALKEERAQRESTEAAARQSKNS